MKYKICVYAICKDEEAFVERWMDSMQEADLVAVTDTGSRDGTAEHLRRRGAQVFAETVEPWRFDIARNLSLGHVPEDVDICVCTDLDEVFSPGWRGCLEKAWRPGVNSGRYLYNWSFRPDGTPDVQFQYFKVHERRGYRWVYPVHEVLRREDAEPEKVVFIDGMVLNHHPDPEKSRSNYLPLLELGAEEDPTDARMAYYLGREYMYRERWEDCIRALMRYLNLPTARWTEERCAAMRWIAESCRSLGKTAEAKRWYLRAVAEAPGMREPWVESAKLAFQLEDWPAVFYMTTQALKINKKSSVYINQGYAWDHTPHDLCAVACYHLGMYADSLDHAQRALELTPGDPRLAENVLLIREKLREEKGEGISG